MRTHQKAFLSLAVICALLSLGMYAEPVPDSYSGIQVETITKKVFPSVVKVEARNGMRKVATGVVIDKDGHVVTTALISPRDEEIYVITSGGERIEAEFLGMDSMTNLAVVRAKNKDLVPITIGRVDNLVAGSWIGVVSISPENEPAVTQGIVSSVAPDRLRLNVWVVPGASGSPVVDNKGRLVGLVRGIYSDSVTLMVEGELRERARYMISPSTAPSSAMTMAVPAPLVEKITSEIKEKGKVSRGWLGVSIVENEGRVEIIDVEKESPAELMGLKEGDVVLEFGGQKVTSTEMLADEIRKRKPGDNVSVKIERGDKQENMEARLGEYSEREIIREFEWKFPRLFSRDPSKRSFPSQPHELRWVRGGSGYIGIYLDELNAELSHYFGLKEGRGLLVSKVEKDSPAEKAGLNVGDVITKADGIPVEEIERLQKIIRRKKKGESVLIEYIREKKSKEVEIKVETDDKGGEFMFSYRSDKIPEIISEDGFEIWENKSPVFEKKELLTEPKSIRKNDLKPGETIRFFEEGLGHLFRDELEWFQPSAKRYRYTKV